MMGGLCHNIWYDGHLTDTLAQVSVIGAGCPSLVRNERTRYVLTAGLSRRNVPRGCLFVQCAPDLRCPSVRQVSVR